MSREPRTEATARPEPLTAAEYQTLSALVRPDAAARVLTDKGTFRRLLDLAIRATVEERVEAGRASQVRREAREAMEEWETGSEREAGPYTHEFTPSPEVIANLPKGWREWLDSGGSEREAGLDVERRLFVLSRLVMLAHDEMPERLNNRTRVNVNHAAAVADPLRGHSCGECNDLLAEYARLAASSETGTVTE